MIFQIKIETDNYWDWVRARDMFGNEDTCPMEFPYSFDIKQINAWRRKAVPNRLVTEKEFDRISGAGDRSEYRSVSGYNYMERGMK